MGEAWIINSDASLKAFCAHVSGLYGENKYLTYSAPRIGVDRSLGQNAIFHIWLGDFACHLAKCHYTQLTDGMIDGIKKTVKGLFYREYPYQWMVHKVICPLTKREKTDYTSSAKWKQGEFFLVLTWLQQFAASQGCVLESRGEFSKLQREQNK